MNGWMCGHIRTKKMISVAVLLVFFASFVLPDAWAAVDRGGAPHDISIPAGGEYASLDIDTFTVPAHLGEIRGKFKGTSDKVIVHIQDAHCNLYAQRKISDIIGYLNKEYGIEMVNLEGGVGDYDLSVFTAITGEAIRREVAEYFVKKGEVNGAEFYAINNPGRVTLWGVEDKDLYIENLKVYRDSLAYKEETDKYLKELTHLLNNLKRHIYTTQLLDMDMAYNAYKAGNTEFREYLEFLLEKAKEHSIDLNGFKDLRLLAESMEMEERIDFKKADTERNALIRELKKRLSKNELRELVARTLDFKTKKVSRKAFNEYLLKKAGELTIDLDRFPMLSMYIDYVTAYEAVDRAMVMDEMEKLEADIKEKLFRNDRQRRLDKLSRNLALLKNAFSLTLTKSDYRYYQENKSSFEMNNFLEFFREEAPRYRITARPDRNITKLDEYREDISRFFEYSFSRDEFFIRNMRFDEKAGSVKSAILMTGGFHTENLCELFKGENISYVSVLPKFTNPRDYKSPYFSLLAGETTGIEQMLRLAFLEVGMMAIAARLNPELAGAAYGEADRLAFKVAVPVVRRMMEYMRARRGENVRVVLVDERKEADSRERIVASMGSGEEIIEVGLWDTLVKPGAHSYDELLNTGFMNLSDEDVQIILRRWMLRVLPPARVVPAGGIVTFPSTYKKGKEVKLQLVGIPKRIESAKGITYVLGDKPLDTLGRFAYIFEAEAVDSTGKHLDDVAIKIMRPRVTAENNSFIVAFLQENAISEEVDGLDGGAIERLDAGFLDRGIAVTNTDQAAFAEDRTHFHATTVLPGSSDDDLERGERFSDLYFMVQELVKPSQEPGRFRGTLADMINMRKSKRRTGEDGVTKSEKAFSAEELDALYEDLFPEEVISSVRDQLLEAVDIMHEEKNILHNDLKPENIFVIEEEDGSLTVKISDFGLSVKTPNCEISSNFIMGSPQFMSNRAFRDNVYNRKSDLYAIGCTLHVLSGKRPLGMRSVDEKVAAEAVAAAAVTPSSSFIGAETSFLASDKLGDMSISHLPTWMEGKEREIKEMFADSTPENNPMAWFIARLLKENPQDKTAPAVVKFSDDWGFENARDARAALEEIKTAKAAPEEPVEARKAEPRGGTRKAAENIIAHSKTPRDFGPEISGDIGIFFGDIGQMRARSLEIIERTYGETLDRGEAERAVNEYINRTVSIINRSLEEYGGTAFRRNQVSGDEIVAVLPIPEGEKYQEDYLQDRLDGAMEALRWHLLSDVTGEKAEVFTRVALTPFGGGVVDMVNDNDNKEMEDKDILESYVAAAEKIQEEKAKREGELITVYGKEAFKRKAEEPRKHFLEDTAKDEEDKEIRDRIKTGNMYEAVRTAREDRYKGLDVPEAILEPLEPDFPCFRMEDLETIWDEARKETAERGVYLVRGPPDTIFVIFALGNGKAQMVVRTAHYRPIGDKAETKFREIREASGRPGIRHMDYFPYYGMKEPQDSIGDHAVFDRLIWEDITYYREAFSDLFDERAPDDFLSNEDIEGVIKDREVEEEGYGFEITSDMLVYASDDHEGVKGEIESIIKGSPDIGERGEMGEEILAYITGVLQKMEEGAFVINMIDMMRTAREEVTRLGYEAGTGEMVEKKYDKERDDDSTKRASSEVINISMQKGRLLEVLRGYVAAQNTWGGHRRDSLGQYYRDSSLSFLERRVFWDMSRILQDMFRGTTLEWRRSFVAQFVDFPLLLRYAMAQCPQITGSAQNVLWNTETMKSKDDRALREELIKEYEDGYFSLDQFLEGLNKAEAKADLAKGSSGERFLTALKGRIEARLENRSVELLKIATLEGRERGEPLELTARLMRAGRAIDEEPEKVVEMPTEVKVKGKGSLIGKLYADDGELLTEGFQTKVENGKLIITHDRRTSPAEVDLASESFSREQREQLVSYLYDTFSGERVTFLIGKDRDIMKGFIEGFAADLKNPEFKVVLLEDHENVLGYTDEKGKVLYINRNLSSSPLTLVHERIESSEGLIEGKIVGTEEGVDPNDFKDEHFRDMIARIKQAQEKGKEFRELISRHTESKGAGKDPRETYKDRFLVDYPKIHDIERKGGIFRFLEILDKEMMDEGKGHMTEGEIVMALYNYSLWKGMDVGVEVLFYGFQDKIDPAGNLDLTEDIQEMLRKLRRGDRNIILCRTNIKAKSVQEKWGRAGSRKFRKIGVDTLFKTYEGVEELKDSVNKAIARAEEDKREGRPYTKIYIDCLTGLNKERTGPDPKNPEYDEAIKLWKENKEYIAIGPDLLDERLTLEDFNVNVLKVMYFGSFVLNDKRMREDFGMQPNDLVDYRRDFINKMQRFFFKFDNLKDRFFGGKDVSEASAAQLDDFMRALRNGQILVETTPMDLEDLRKLDKSLREIYKSL